MRLGHALHELRFGPPSQASRDGALFLAWVLQGHAPAPADVSHELLAIDPSDEVGR